MTRTERLARAVLLIHRGGRWSGQDRILWTSLTGTEEATTKNLCDLARRLALEEFEEGLGRIRETPNGEPEA